MSWGSAVALHDAGGRVFGHAVGAGVRKEVEHDPLELYDCDCFSGVTYRDPHKTGALTEWLRCAPANAVVGRFFGSKSSNLLGIDIFLLLLCSLVFHFAVVEHLQGLQNALSSSLTPRDIDTIGFVAKSLKLQPSPESTVPAFGDSFKVVSLGYSNVKSRPRALSPKLKLAASPCSKSTTTLTNRWLQAQTAAALWRVKYDGEKCDSFYTYSGSIMQDLLKSTGFREAVRFVVPQPASRGP